MATQILLYTMQHSSLPSLVIPCEAALMQMTIDNFHIPYEVTRVLDGGFVQVRKLNELHKD
jgi:hypothetical protein